MTAVAVLGALLERADAPLGAVVGVSDRGTLDVSAAGVRTIAGEPMTTSTVFDIASVSKVAGTTAALHRLVRLGMMGFDDPLDRFLPASPCAAATTVRDLLLHRAGLWEWQPLYLSAHPRRAVDELPLRYEPGTGRHYSDLGFMLLGDVVSVVAGAPLERALRYLVHAPLGMADTGFGSGAAEVAASSRGDEAERRMVATGEPYPVVRAADRDHVWRTAELVGEANDGNCFHAFGGISGHAGLFATAADLLALAASLSARPDAAEDLWGADVSADVFRDGPDAGQALGWRSLGVSLRGEKRRMLWHPGFTGCALGFVPGEDLAVVLLTNRLFAEKPRPVTDMWVDALAAVPDLTVLPDWEH